LSNYINKEIEDVYSSIKNSKKKFEMGLKQSSTEKSKASNNSVKKEIIEINNGKKSHFFNRQQSILSDENESESL